MKNKKRKQKNIFFIQNKKWFFVSTALFTIIAITCITLRVIPQKTVYSKNPDDSSTSFVSQNIQGNAQLTSSNSPKIIYPDLSHNNNIYVLSKAAAPCKNYKANTESKIFSFRCKTTRSLFRGILTKTINVTGYNKLKIEAHLEVKNYTKNYFASCNYQGVDSNNAVDLIILSSDPNPKLQAECNHEVGEEKWSHCSITNQDINVITHCGLSQCSASKNCAMDINVSGLDNVYMAFKVADDWFADVEGTLSSVRVTPTK